MPALYDRIGCNDANLRRPDRRIASTIDTALGDAAIVLNVGAGAGSSEPITRTVIAVEPSEAMLRDLDRGCWLQRNHHLLALDALDLDTVSSAAKLNPKVANVL